jgi:hypothetical protein
MDSPVEIMEQYGDISVDEIIWRFSQFAHKQMEEDHPEVADLPPMAVAIGQALALEKDGQVTRTVGDDAIAFKVTDKFAVGFDGGVLPPAVKEVVEAGRTVSWRRGSMEEIISCRQ